MKTSMLLSAESTPTRFISVKGLSSPFRDQPATSLTVSSHVIDISPSPPPPASILANLSGRFEDPLSPDVKTPTESELNPTLDGDEFSILEPMKLNARHQPVGLGLGIDTGESTFANFLPMSEEILNSPPTLPWGMEESTLSSVPLVTLSTRRVELSPWSTSFENITPERSINHDFGTQGVLHDQEPGTTEHYSYATFTGETNPDSPSKFLPSLSVKSPPHVSLITPQAKPVETENVPSISQRLTRRLLSFNSKSLVGDAFRSGKAAPELQTFPELVISPLTESSAVPMPLSMKFSPRGRLLSTLRHRMKLRGVEYPESAQVTQISPVLRTRGGGDAVSFAAPSQDAQSSGKNDSPLELPSSPAFPSHSPNLRDTPGSFSPLMYDNMAFSPAMSHAHQAHVMPVHPGATTLVFSIVAGSLGFVGICLILVVLAWKKNGCFPGLLSWKRKHRGTAYDEFMEEKSCWVADKKPKIYRESKPNPERTVTIVNRKSNSLYSGSEHGRSTHPVSRSPSQAPSIPPLAYLANGKLSIDSIRLEFPAPVSSPTVPSIFSGLSSNYEDDLKENDYKVISTLKNRTQPEPSPHKIDFSHDTHLASRPRSDSKSSTISKASLKSISSIASFLLSITKFDSLSAGNKKGKLEMGISSENYKNVRESLNSFNDPFSMSSPKYTKKSCLTPFHQSIKRADSSEGLVRAASVQLDRLNYSIGSQDAPKRPNTISCVPPAILITEHPSELIPPSPPRSATYDQRPESIGTFLTRYSNFNSPSEQDLHPEGSNPSTPPQEECSTSHVHQHFHDSRTESKLPDSRAKIFREVERAERLPAPRIRSLTSGQEWRVKDPRINSVSSLISHRSRTSELLETSTLQDFDRSNVKFDFTPKRTSLNTLNSSQTIRELAAVTEDLRALIDSEIDPDCSWDLPSQFHQTVPDWVTLPAQFMVAPPMRPPKSASRYSSMKPTAIEYESTSTPCSPSDPNPLSSRRVSSHSSWDSTAIQYPQQNFDPSSSTKAKHVSTGSRVKKSNSDSSIETVVSAESNASILEIASLHTAQTQSVRGVSAEFVIRQSIAQIQALEAHNRLRMAVGAKAE